MSAVGTASTTRPSGSGPEPLAAPIVGAATVDPAVIPHRFSAEDFHRLVDLDAFPPDARVYLWDGIICEMMAKKMSHALAGARATNTLFRVVREGWSVWPENPVTVGEDKVPLPDVCLLRGRLDDYRARRPTAADVGLIVEVADSSGRFDLGPKLAGYAAAGVPAHWVVDTPADVVRAFADPAPSEGRYASSRVAARGDSIGLALDGLAVGPVAADDLLP